MKLGYSPQLVSWQDCFLGEAEEQLALQQVEEDPRQQQKVMADWRRQQKERQTRSRYISEADRVSLTTMSAFREYITESSIRKNV